MNKDLTALAREFPEMIISVKLADLMEANTMLIAETRARLEQTIKEASTEGYMTRGEVRKLLKVGDTTLWRWQKSGYLVPINVGGKRIYRKSDVQSILKGER